MFEYILCETLTREGILPFYYQAAFSLVPNADFDIVCYNPKRPVVLSAKVSLRERYKQADLEGTVLRQVYRRAESYLLTLSEAEALSVQDKIKEGDIGGLTQCVLADTPAYDELLAQLKTRDFSVMETITPLRGKLISGSDVPEPTGKVMGRAECSTMQKNRVVLL